MKGDKADPHYGWEAPHYRHLVPARSLILSAAAHPAARVVTALGPSVKSVTLSSDGTVATVALDDRGWTLALADPGSPTQITTVAASGQPAEAAWNP